MDRYLRKGVQIAKISNPNIIRDLLNDGFVLMTEDEINSYLETQEKNNQSFLEFREKQNKINELTNWFDSYFDKQLNQSRWQKNFKVSEDPYFKDENGNPKTYADVEELKEKAELVASEIRKLKEELNNADRL